MNAEIEAPSPLRDGAWWVAAWVGSGCLVATYVAFIQSESPGWVLLGAPVSGAIIGAATTRLGIVRRVHDLARWNRLAYWIVPVEAALVAAVTPLAYAEHPDDHSIWGVTALVLGLSFAAQAVTGGWLRRSEVGKRAVDPSRLRAAAPVPAPATPAAAPAPALPLGPPLRRRGGRPRQRRPRGLRIFGRILPPRYVPPDKLPTVAPDRPPTAPPDDVAPDPSTG